MSPELPPGPAAPTAVVFPGQGSQAPGFGSAWRHEPAWSVVDAAEEATGRELAPLLLDPAADLSRTEDSQLAVLVGSLVAWEATRAIVGAPIAVAGHSLGQITALIAAGAVTFADGVRLAVARAEATQAAADDEPGVLVALLGADADLARAACEGLDCWIANVNAPGQVVIGGRPGATDTAVARARDAGVRRARRLAVGGAFHTPLMSSAAAALRPTLAATPFADTDIPVVANHDAAAHRDGAGWPERSARQLETPVRWSDSVGTLVALGAQRAVEVGPGTALTGLIRRCAPDLVSLSIATPTDLEPAATGAPAP